MSKPKVKFAVRTTSVRQGGKYPTSVQKGQAWYADHPLVVAHPDLFADDPPEVLPRGWSPPVEQATASPGEKRTTRRANDA